MTSDDAYNRTSHRAHDGMQKALKAQSELPGPEPASRRPPKPVLPPLCVPKALKDGFAEADAVVPHQSRFDKVQRTMTTSTEWPLPEEHGRLRSSTSQKQYNYDHKDRKDSVSRNLLKTAQVLGVSPRDLSHQWGLDSPPTLFNSPVKKSTGKLRLGPPALPPEDQLPAFPCCREDLLPFKLLQDSVRQDPARASALSLTRRGRARKRDLFMTATIWPQELSGFSPTSMRYSRMYHQLDVHPSALSSFAPNSDAPASMLHSFDQASLLETGRLILTSQSFVTVTDDGKSHRGSSACRSWSLRIGGVELDPRKMRTPAAISTSQALARIGTFAEWTVHLRSQEERQMWQKNIKASIMPSSSLYIYFSSPH